jgi:HK97 gp10 family phage protein
MISFKLNNSEIKRAIDNIKAYEIKKKAEIVKQVALSALKIEKDAKLAVVVDTGRLRSSIAVDFKDNGLGAEVGTNVKYAPYVEFGTSKMSAKPFLFPAAEAERQNFLNNLRKILSKK